MNATDLNVSALADVVTYHGGKAIFPNAIPREYAGPHIKRCQKAGLFTVAGSQIVLTVEGVDRVIRSMERTLSRLSWRLEGTPNGSTDERIKAHLVKMVAALEALRVHVAHR